MRVGDRGRRGRVLSLGLRRGRDYPVCDRNRASQCDTCSSRNSRDDLVAQACTRDVHCDGPDDRTAAGRTATQCQYGNAAE